MTRFELLQLLVAQAKANGFEFRRWYVGKLGLPWTNTRTAIETLAVERRYYALLFSHEFAMNFWKASATSIRMPQPVALSIAPLKMLSPPMSGRMPKWS